MRFFRHLHLAAFPLIEAVAFIFFIRFFDTNLPASLFFLFLSGLCLNFSVHVTFHEIVHSTGAKNSPLMHLVNVLATILLGIPFDGYRWHHYNHHRHDNGLDDYSSTWKLTSEGPRPRNWFVYVVSWPVQILRGRSDLLIREKKENTAQWISKRIDQQKYVLLLLYFLLGAFSIKWFLLYLLNTYVGWALINLHNYGQHLPLANKAAYATSYQGQLYNKIFCNNGIHYEHHAEARIPWYDHS
jgi:fatty acid desaturase